WTARERWAGGKRWLRIDAHGRPVVWDEANGEIVYKSYVHLGIAAATPRGLVVPKVHDADQMSLRELAEAIGALTVKARDGKTTPAEMANGTFTITNVGVFGVDTGTPIINPGESAILALGAIRDITKPGTYHGFPARVDGLRISAALAELPRLRDRIHELERLLRG
ncbi:2-oxo acid dehydrogenase subunit E2, partial [Kibdelosporangium lantanae]